MAASKPEAPTDGLPQHLLLMEVALNKFYRRYQCPCGSSISCYYDHEFKPVLLEWATVHGLHVVTRSAYASGVPAEESVKVRGRADKTCVEGTS